MIFKEIKTGNIMDCKRWSCTTTTKTIQLPTEKEVRNFCLCSYKSICHYYEMAFTDIDNVNDNYKNDYRKFLLNPLSLTSAFSFILLDKNGNEHIIYSDTEQTTDFGVIYEQGFNDSQPFQVGVNVIWYKVAEKLGYGDYKIKTSQTDFGNEVITESHTFRVVKYDTQRANGTVKIQVDNVGVTMNGKDWTGLLTNSNSVFENMIRVNGLLKLTDPDIEIENIEDGRRESVTVQTKLTDNYSLKINRIPFDIGNSLIHEDVVMNWKITDYNVFNEDLRDKEVIVQSSSVTNTADYTRKSYELTAKTNISKLNRKFV